MLENTVWNKRRGYTHLAEALVQVWQGSRDDATVAVALGPSCDGEGFPAARLAVRKYGAIVASQYAANTYDRLSENHYTWFIIVWTKT